MKLHSFRSIILASAVLITCLAPPLAPAQVTDSTTKAPRHLDLQATAVASAATVDLNAVAGDYVHVTGTTSITALGTCSAGHQVILVFDGALTFTHNATTLILPTSANITTAAGDTALMRSEGSGNWRCIVYSRKSGELLVAAPTFATSVTTPKVIGGTAVGSDATVQSTSGVGDGTDQVLIKVGNNGATTAATFDAAGQTLGTKVTVPAAVGGTDVGSDLVLQSTSGVGDGTDTVVVKAGNNGATTVGTFDTATGYTSPLGVKLGPTSADQAGVKGIYAPTANVSVTVPSITDPDIAKVDVDVSTALTYQPAVGDAVVVIPTAALPTNCRILGAQVISTDTVQITYGSEGGNVTGAATNHKFLFFDLTP